MIEESNGGSWEISDKGFIVRGDGGLDQSFCSGDEDGFIGDIFRVRMDRVGYILGVRKMKKQVLERIIMSFRVCKF